MKTTTLAALAAACALLAACGGGGDAAPPAPPPPPAPAPAPQSYDYVAPGVGGSDTWLRTLTDDQGHAVDMQLRVRFTQANPDGTMVWTFDDPTGVDVAQDGLTFRVVPEVEDVSATGGALDYTLTRVDGSTEHCVYGAGNGTGVAAADAAAHRLAVLAATRAEGLVVGKTYTGSFTITCAGQPAITYHSTAIVEGLEDVTVPAGTFHALREQINQDWVVGGFTNTSSTTMWRDTAHSLLPVMSIQDTTHGDPSQPYFAHDRRELSSRQ
ncbi:MAG TPA: hypothetical protein VIP05_35045 [Burkholderiaceae bacterium]